MTFLVELLGWAVVGYAIGAGVTKARLYLARRRHHRAQRHRSRVHWHPIQWRDRSGVECCALFCPECFEVYDLYRAGQYPSNIAGYIADVERDERRRGGQG